MQLEITNRCNFQCIMCPAHRPGANPGREQGLMGIEEYIRILEQFTRLGGVFLIPQGAGESFIHPDCMEMIRIAKQRFRLSMGLNTNGSLLNSRIMQELIDLRIDQFGFSIDAGTESTFRAVTGRTGLETVEGKVHELVEIRRASGSQNPLIRVLIVEQEANREEIEDYVKRWIPVVDEVVVQTCRVGQGRKLAEPRSEPRRPCRHFFDTAFVQWDGDMVVCCEDWNSETVLGNLHDTPLKDVWFGEKMRAYRKQQRLGKYVPPAICADCEAWAGGRSVSCREGDLLITTGALTRVYRKGG